MNPGGLSFPVQAIHTLRLRLQRICREFGKLYAAKGPNPSAAFPFLNSHIKS